MFTPLVSIIIPVYNGSNFMREAIDSALAQTYKNIEVIVINDGSNDNGATDDIARSFGDKIRYFKKENGGVSSALNKGISEMKGEYFSWLSHDDVYEIDKVERQVETLNSVDRNTLICCDYNQINEKSQLISGYRPSVGFEPNKVYTSKEALKGLLTKSVFSGCALLISKEVFEKCGLFDESLRFCQDVFMWYKIFLNGYSLVYTSDRLVKSRIHSNQLTQIRQDLYMKECGEFCDYLAASFAELSTKEYNFLEMYLLSYAKFLQFEKIKSIIAEGKKVGLISKSTIIKVYFLYNYGKVRPFIRSVYYRLFRKVKTK